MFSHLLTFRGKRSFCSSFIVHYTGDTPRSGMGVNIIYIINIIKIYNIYY